MKYIKPYNESIKDYLKPKNEEEILKSLEGTSNYRKLRFALEHNLDWLIDNVINSDKKNDIFPTEQKLIILSALYNNKINIVKKLLKIWGNSIINSSMLDTYFQRSIEKNNMEMFKYLIELGVNIKLKYSNYMVLAASNNNIEILKILLDNGVSKEYEPNWIKSLILDEKYNEVIRLLSEKIPSIKNIIVNEYDIKQKQLKTLQNLL